MHRHGTSYFKYHQRRLGNEQLIPYPKGLQQKWESNLCPIAIAGSKVQLTRLAYLTKLRWNKKHSKNSDTSTSVTFPLELPSRSITLIVSLDVHYCATPWYQVWRLKFPWYVHLFNHKSKLIHHNIDYSHGTSAHAHEATAHKLWAEKMRNCGIFF